MTTFNDLKSNSAALTMIERAADILRDVGFKDFLEERARPVIYKYGYDLNIQATQAARSAGFYECIDLLFNFKSLVIEQERRPEVPAPTYGGAELAVSQGYITKEEALKYGNNT